MKAFGSRLRGSATSQWSARAIALQPDLVLCTGDMVAAQRIPPLARPELEAMWAAFHSHVSDPLAHAGLPFAVTPGNHDAAWSPRFALDRSVYREQWLSRRPRLDFVAGSEWPFRYGFTMADVLLVSLDVPFTGPLPESERQWLQALLDGPAAQQRRRVVFSHVPLWPFAVGREHEFTGDERLEQILREGRVELYLSGHHHAFYPGVKDGVLHVGQGCLGAAPRPLIGTRERAPRSFTLIDFAPDGSLKLDALSGPGYDRPIDRMTLPPRIVTPRATLVRDDLAGARR